MKLSRAERIGDLIKCSGKTAKEIAKEITEQGFVTISSATLSDLTNTNKEKGFDYKYFVALARYFNVSADYLLCLTEEKTNNKDIRGVCDYTGLREETVDYLHSLFTDEIERECLVQCFGDIPTSEAYNFYYRFIDLIIKNSECRLGDLSIAFKDYKKQCDEIIKTGTNDYYWNASSKREEEKEHIDIAEFKLNKLINLICDDLGKEVFAESETEALKVIEQLKEQGKKGGVKNG